MPGYCKKCGAEMEVVYKDGLPSKLVCSKNKSGSVHK